MNSRILKFEILGMFFISLLGSLFHFTFNLLNRFWLAGIFSAVNESTWEHLKLAVIPAILWAILENKVFKIKANNFLFAKAVGVYLMPILIVIFFYSYKAILGDHNLLLDITIFFLAVIIGQIISYRIMSRPEFSQKFNNLSFFFLAILLVAFIVFTFYPPEMFLFKDPASNQTQAQTRCSWEITREDLEKLGRHCSSIVGYYYGPAIVGMPSEKYECNPVPGCEYDPEIVPFETKEECEAFCGK